MAKDEEEQESRGFKVQDRRRFVDADDRAASAPEPEAPREEPAPAAPTGAPEPSPHVHDDVEQSGFGEMSFSTFVMGLTTQALMHLGEIPDPVHQSVHHDLPAAKQMIDLLGILREKTKGNLDAAEEQLLGEMLYDLRMRYVEVARSR
jgi:Domain of unknown function (DUF1844)